MNNLFASFQTIADLTATTAALIAYAVTKGMDETEIARQANAANPRVWATEACAAMDIDGDSSAAIFGAYGNPMVELCEVASGVTAMLVAKCGSVDFRRIEARVNDVVLMLAETPPVRIERRLRMDRRGNVRSVAIRQLDSEPLKWLAS